MSDFELKVAFPGGVRVSTDYKGFVINTDQPVEDGGESSAPEPFILFLASLATCAGYYVIAFCQSRKISTEGLGLTMKADRDAKGRLLALVAFEISLPPDFPEKYVPAVIRAAESCTVKKQLQSPPKIETRAHIRKG